MIKFEYGNLSERYPDESYWQLKERRVNNFESLKLLIDSNIPFVIEDRFEVFITESIVIDKNKNIKGGGDLVCWPYVATKNQTLKMFDVHYNVEFNIDNVNVIREHQKKYETYNYTKIDTNKIQIDNPMRDFVVGETIFIAWKISTIGFSSTIVSLDGNVIEIDREVPDNGKAGFYFQEDVNLSDYYQYGDFWYTTDFVDCIASSHPYQGEADTKIKLKDCTISGFERNINLSTAACKLHLDNVIISKAMIGISFFSMSVANDQTVTAINGLTLFDNGYKIAGGIVSATANNILGSGAYLHPNIIANVDKLILSENIAAQWRQYSGSGTKPIKEYYRSWFGEIIASGISEYDVLFSNSMPTDVDFINCQCAVYLGYMTTINRGIINMINCTKHSQPDSGVDNTLTINNCKILDRQYLSFSETRNEKATVIYNNCDFVQTDNFYYMVLSDIASLKRVEFNNCTYDRKSDQNPDNKRFVRPNNINQIQFNNLRISYKI